MIIAPKVRGFICTTAHPVGCKANVKQQIDYVINKAKFKIINNASSKKLNVLVIGASTGYGLASRIVSSFAFGANTIGIFYERNSLAAKTGSAGWYNSAAFENEASLAGIYAKSINGDAFSSEIKLQTIDLIKKDWGKVDLIIYSLAAPRRVDDNGIVYNSVLKPVGQTYSNKTVDINTGRVFDAEILPANEAEIEATIKVMGGEDLKNWVDYLDRANVIANNCMVIAYSYIGPQMTHQIYRNGTIGYAKKHLEKTVQQLNQFLITKYHGRAIISVNKALVTQASSAIPVVPLYISLLYKVMKNFNTHEGCIEQIFRLFNDYLSLKDVNSNSIDKLLDVSGRIRLDDLELQQEVQQEVAKLWDVVDTSNILSISDLTGYREEFYKLFGFNFANVNYNEDCDIDISIPSIVEYA